MRRILVFGDSIVWGAFDEEYNGWPHRLQRLFTTDIVHAEVYALGVCGEGVHGVGGRIQQECAARRPTDIVLATGLNDASHFVHPVMDWTGRFVRGFEWVLRCAMQDPAVNVLAVGPTPVDERKTAPCAPAMPNLFYRMDAVRKVHHLIATQAELFKVPFLPLIDELDVRTDLSKDGLHPNASGHATIARLVYARLTAA
jgi:lysophospholipase L1-like esterase